MKRASSMGMRKSLKNTTPINLFSSTGSDAVQVVAAKEDNAYKIFTCNAHCICAIAGGRKIIADIFNATSAEDHQYDLPFQYNGNLINTSFKYNANTKNRKHWKEEWLPILMERSRSCSERYIAAVYFFK